MDYKEEEHVEVNGSHNPKVLTKEDHKARPAVERDGTQTQVKKELSPERLEPAPRSNAFVGSLVKPEEHAVGGGAKSSQVPQPDASGPPVSLKRPISPPATGARLPPATNSESSAVKQPLLPRKVPKEPAGFAKRQMLLKMLHGGMGKLNKELVSRNDPEAKALHLSGDQLIGLAIDQEAKFAVDHHSVYENLMKNRVAKMKKMSVEDWIKERKAAQEEKKKAEEGSKSVETNLTPKEEILVLSRLVTNQAGLGQFGYVTAVPTEEELAPSRKALEWSDSWEKCDRCATRFQVFPNRRAEDGALTSGGKCCYHWGKIQYAKKTKTEVGPQRRYTCCNELVGGTSQGCVTHESHVFKIEDKGRLSLILPFKETPANANANPDMAVCFDCEMGYTTYGLELMRLTAISWPEHKPLLDVLVRPIGAVLDLNTRFSGIQPEQFFNAKPYDPNNPQFDPANLQIAGSPAEARELLLSHLSPKTPLLGHALDNDLNAVRLVHPTIVDTIALFPHAKGLPYRHALRNLARQHLEIAIQQGGAAGHDSYEDARTTGELVRFKVAQEWKVMKARGWEIVDGQLVAPAKPAVTAPTPPEDTPEGDSQGTKRKRSSADEVNEEDIRD